MRTQQFLKAALAGAALAAALASQSIAAPAAKFEVAYSRSVAAGPITGRLIVAVSRTAEPEPRRIINLLRSPAVFGVDIDAVQPGAVMAVDASAVAYPMEDLSKLPGGDYFVQALLIRYTQFHRADGHTIWMPAASPLPPAWIAGNLYSKVQKAHLDPAQGFTLRLDLTDVIATDPDEPDTQWLKTVRIKSKVLSDFWGAPMYIGARVLLPKGFAEHPQERYPGIYVFGHGTPFFFDTDPASHEPELKRARNANLQTGYEFYQTWIRDDFPRVVGICPIIPSPYALESYAVNTANQGPWGDAITKELIPYLEREFRLIAQPYARIVEGASTGGWEALAMQLHYPDFFGGAWVFNPDPIDFHRYQAGDIYQDENMFAVATTAWTTTERPMKRNNEGQTLWTMRQYA